MVKGAGEKLDGFGGEGVGDNDLFEETYAKEG